MSDVLSQRAKEVLRAVVEHFIASAEPVGSAHLSKRKEFEVSPATLRNVLHELEELGYLSKPHTSAGRIPTDLGYRFFVDSLIRLKNPGQEERDILSSGIVHHVEVDERLNETGRALQHLSKHATVVLAPRPISLRVNRIEFVRLRENKLVAVLVGENGTVQNKLLSLDFSITPDELTHASNYLNDLLTHGLNVEDLRGRILVELENERSQYDALIAKALKLGAAATDLSSNERVIVEGTGTFLDAKEFTENVARMKSLFRALDEKHKLLQLLERVQRANEMQIFIGTESDFSAQGEVSVIATPYGNNEGVIGTLGVIGPTRMDYPRIIPLVEFAAKALSKSLDDDNSES